MMRKSITVITVVLLAAGLAGCKAAEQGTYDDKIESGTVCIDGYLYAWAYKTQHSEGFDMEPMGQVCGVE